MKKLSQNFSRLLFNVNMKILTIDDDRFFQKFYQTKLTEHGFEVVVAKDGEEGIALARQLHPDLILLDIIMPKKDGFEVLAELSKDETLKKIPVIVFSTLGQEQEVERAKKLGARDYINKGFYDLPALLQKISSYVK